MHNLKIGDKIRECYDGGGLYAGFRKSKFPQRASLSGILPVRGFDSCGFPMTSFWSIKSWIKIRE